MKGLNPTQTAIVNAIRNYREGARNIVAVFETVISNYWGSDSCSCENLEFFVNAAAKTPRIQSDLLSILKRASSHDMVIGYFDVTKEKDGSYKIVNRQEKAATATRKAVTKVTKEEKARARLNVKAFVTAAYATMGEAAKGGNKEKEAKGFDKDAFAKSLTASIERQALAILTDNPDLSYDATVKMISDAVAVALTKENIVKIRTKGREAKAGK